MSSTLIAILAIVAVAVLAMLLRRAGGGDTAPSADTPGGSLAPPEALLARAGGDDEEEFDELDEEALAARHVLVTTEGIALAPTGRTLRLVPLLRDEQTPEWLRTAMAEGSIPYTLAEELQGLTHPDRITGAATLLSAGDYTAARVRRDAQGQWCVETLGRDGDYGFLPFGTETSAQDALALLEEKGIVHHAMDEHGEPIPPSPEDFEEARRRYEETERQLALAGDEDEPPPPGDWSSRR